MPVAFSAIAAAATSNNAAVSPVVPAAGTNDLLVSTLVLRSGSATATATSGWTVFGPYRNSSGVTIYFATAKYTGQSSMTWTPAGGAAGMDLIARVSAWSGADRLGTAGTVYSSGSTTGTSIGPISGVTVAAGGGVIAVGGQADDYGTVPSAPSGWTLLGGPTETTTGNDLSVIPVYRLSAAGETSPSVTITGNPTAAALRVGVQIPIIPSATAVAWPSGTVMPHTATPPTAHAAADSISTAAFTPPPGALLLAFSGYDTSTVGRSAVHATTSGQTSAWTKVLDRAVGDGAASIGQARVTGGGSTTISSTWNSTTNSDHDLYVPVLEDAEVVQSGTVPITGSSQTVTINRTRAGSRVLFVFASFNTPTEPTPPSGTVRVATNEANEMYGFGVYATPDLAAGSNSFAFTGLGNNNNAFGWVEVAPRADVPQVVGAYARTDEAGVVDGVLLTRPAGTVTGDLLLASVVIDRDATDGTVEIGTPVGWTKLTTAGDTNRGWASVFVKTAADGDPTSWLFQDLAPDAAACDLAGSIIAVRGANTSVTGTSVSMQTDSAAGTTMTAPGRADGAAGGLLVNFYNVETGSNAARTISGYSGFQTQRAQSEGTAGYTHSSVATERLGVDGTTGTRTATVSASSSWLTASVVLVAGAAGATLTATAGDTAEATDQADRTLAMQRDASSTAGATDAASRTVDAQRAAGDTAGATDAVSYVLARNETRASADTAGATDSATWTMSAQRTAGDVAAATDAATASAAFARGPADTAATADAVATALGAQRQAADTAAATDSVTYEMVRNEQRTAASTAGATDAATWTMEVGAAEVRSPADTAGATDAATWTMDSARTASSAAGATDAVETASGVSRVAGDSAAATDAASAVLSASRDLSSQAHATDAVDATLARSRDANSTAGAVDAVSYTLGQEQRPADVAGAVDAASRTMAMQRGPEDTAGATDTVTWTMTVAASRSAADTADATDDVSVTRTVQRGAASTAGATDAVTWDLAQLTSRTAADTAAATDQATAALAAARGPADAAGATDAVTWELARVIERTVSSTAGAVDDLATVRTVERVAASTAAATDTVTAGRGISVLVHSAAGAVDAVVSQLLEALGALSFRYGRLRGPDLGGGARGARLTGRLRGGDDDSGQIRDTEGGGTLRDGGSSGDLEGD